MSNKLEYTAIFIFLLYAIVLALGSNQKYPTKIYYNNFFPYLADKPLSEDGYYALTVAWNIAEGKGITYNFNRPTTGIQPLSVFVFAAIAKVVIAAGENKISFVRAIIIFSILLEVFFFFIVKNISNALLSLTGIGGQKPSPLGEDFSKLAIWRITEDHRIQYMI